ncbi:MAG: TauD/TfdA family dioxygenase, partial [Actinomycetota bacterium]
MATATEPPTPDFYRYPLTAPAHAHLDGRFVVVTWPDGVSLRAFDLWLVENTMDRAIDLATREGVLDPAYLSPDPGIERAELDDDGALVVTWGAEGGRSVFHPGWLRHVAEGRHRPDATLPTAEPWTTSELDQPPTRDGAALVGPEGQIDVDLLDVWLGDAVRHGLARLRDVGTDLDLLPALAAAIGPVRHTNFGPIWDVRADVEPGSTANTTLRLCPHTDLPTRETPPGFQVLQCLANTATGGWSTMTDGLALAAHLAEHYPEHHEALTTLNWIFFNRGEGIDHRWSGPILDTGG